VLLIFRDVCNDIVAMHGQSLSIAHRYGSVYIVLSHYSVSDLSHYSVSVYAFMDNFLFLMN
jgi:hypothetical protein